MDSEEQNTDRRTLLGIRLEAAHVNSLAKKLSIFCPFPEALYETEFKGDGQVHLVEETSK